MTLLRWACLVLFVLVSSIVHATPQETFFSSLLPAIKQTSTTVLADRDKLQGIYQQYQLTHGINTTDKQYLMRIAKQYNMDRFTESKNADWTHLLSRVDVIPVSMVLAQAADESAWGRSRFARLGYNYFGQWCFTKGCGIVPLARAKGAHHEVRRFKSRKDAIAHYFHNLNTGASYENLRALRQTMRQKGNHLNGSVMAKGLLHYSALGAKYVRDIQSLIRHYHLERYDQL